MWSEVSIGKWRDKGKTLPQIVVSDPDWFFWACEEDIFKGALKSQAERLARRAKAIKLPPTQSGKCIQYMLTHDGKFAGFHVIPIDQPAHEGSSTEVRRPTLNLSAPRAFKSYDKTGARLMLDTFKYYWFDKKSFTKARVEAFFDDPKNFKNP